MKLYYQMTQLYFNLAATFGAGLNFKVCLIKTPVVITAIWMLTPHVEFVVK